MKKRLVAVDLDRTLAYYDKAKSRRPDGSFNTAYIGEPIPEMVEACKMLLARGHNFRIFTARVSPRPDGSDAVAKEVIVQWAMKVFGRYIEVTCIKSYEFDEIWDDLACSVEPNTGRFLVPSRVLGPPPAQTELGADGRKL